MKVRFKLPWRHYRRGHVLTDMADGLANELLRRGIVETYVPSVETGTRDQSHHETGTRRFLAKRR